MSVIAIPARTDYLDCKESLFSPQQPRNWKQFKTRPEVTTREAEWPSLGEWTDEESSLIGRKHFFCVLFATCVTVKPLPLTHQWREEVGVWACFWHLETIPNKTVLLCIHVLAAIHPERVHLQSSTCYSVTLQNTRVPLHTAALGEHLTVTQSCSLPLWCRYITIWKWEILLGWNALMHKMAHAWFISQVFRSVVFRGEEERTIENWCLNLLDCRKDEIRCLLEWMSLLCSHVQRRTKEVCGRCE